MSTSGQRPREGDWFAVPLDVGGFAAGLVARAPRKGDTLLGYFLGPIRSEPPTPDEVDDYTHHDAARICRFVDEALVTGRWPLIKRADDWRREDWPMPEFHVPEAQELFGHSLAVAYSEDDPERFVGQRQIRLEEEATRPPDHGVDSPAYIEYHLGGWLGAALPEPPKISSELMEEGVRYFIVVPRAHAEEGRHELLHLAFDEVDLIEEGDQAWLVAFRGGEIESLSATTERDEAELEGLAKRLGGEYNGREWALPAR